MLICRAFMMMPISFRNAWAAAVAALVLLVPVAAMAQPPDVPASAPDAVHAGAQAHAPGGEANLVLPDLSQVRFGSLGNLDGHTLLSLGLIVTLAGLRVRARHLPAAAASPGASLDARDLRADLRDLQDLPDHAGPVHPPARAVHRLGDRPLLRRPAAVPGREGGDHPGVQPGRHRRQLRRRLVRHPHQHLRQLPHGVRQPRGQALPALRHPAQGGHEHRDAADLGRAVPDAVHPALRARRLRRAVLHRLRHRRVARRRRAAHRRRHLHQDRRHRLRPDEDRLQHQGRRRAEPRRDRRLHRRQRRRLGRAVGRRVRDLRRHRRGADHVHHAGGAGPDRPGPAAGLDLHDARRDGHRQRRSPTW